MLYRGRHAIDPMFGRLKLFRRIATRYDHLVTNYLAAVCLTATVSYRLRVPSLSRVSSFIRMKRKEIFQI